MNYFIIDEKDSRQGPYTFEELKSLPITNETMVWYDGIDDWKKAEEIAELKDIAIKLPPPFIKESSQQNQPIQGEPDVTYVRKNKTTEPFAIATFIAGILGFLIFPIIFIPIGWISAIISYFRLKDNPDYTGSVFRIIGAILTIVNCLWLMHQYRML